LARKVSSAAAFARAGRHAPGGRQARNHYGFAAPRRRASGLLSLNGNSNSR
jgi:hypothetical protein